MSRNAVILKMYLAGAIRDDHIEEDVGWRREVIMALADIPVAILNPLAGKTYNKRTHDWDMHGIVPTASVIVPHDFWCVDHADIALFNFRSLTQKYPNIGTLVEFGRATGTGALIYSIVDTDYTGHGNAKLYKLHPFISRNSAAVFNTVQEAIEFISESALALTGDNPHFSGVIDE